MPTNQQRREAAKRKLQRQLVRRDERARARRQRLLIIGVAAAVLLTAGVIWFVASPDKSTSSDASTPDEPTTPCSYPASGTAAREVTAPSNLSPANTGTVDAEIKLNGAAVPVTLDRELAPCAVNSFLSLASQGFYDDTDCHRLTNSGALNILQCGDPSGVGNGGPGYTFAGETQDEVKYEVGTVALANSGPDTNGSQFFIVYGNTEINGYTVIGKVSADGMKAVDAIAEQGVTGKRQTGKPIGAAKIDSVTVPADAVAASGVWPTETSGAEAVPSEPLLPEETSGAESPAATSPAEPSAPETSAAGSSPAETTPTETTPARSSAAATKTS